MTPPFRLAAVVWLVLFSAVARAGQVQVAVASNFSAPMNEIAALFLQDTGHQALLSFGSTGKLYAQISNGAPFEVLLAADQSTPARLEKEGDGVPGRFTYAIGSLVLWSAKADYVDGQGAVLLGGHFRHLALASPKTAPYGAAARQVLSKLGIYDQLNGRIVMGENITQTYQFVATENAELGFIALSQVMEKGKLVGGSVWRIPDDYYQPIRQDAVLLATGKDNPAAQALLEYLQGERAATVIRDYGYKLPAASSAGREAVQGLR